MLNQKTKKIWSRLGAGMLLGLSLFNLGGFLGRNNTSLPKAWGNFRRRDDRYSNPELKGILQTVEEEAQSVISQQDKIHKNLEVQQLSFGQNFLRYSVVTSWFLAMGVLFTSLVFNFPLALGKAVLSLLPGTAHLAVLQLTTDQKTVIPGEKITLTLNLKNDEPVSAGKVFLQYPQGKFFLENIDSRFSPQIHFQSDGLLLTFDDLKEFSAENKSDTLANISFSVGDDWTNKDDLINPIKIVWDKSLILDVREEKQTVKNILGKVIDAQFSVATGKIENLYCQLAKANIADEKFWKEWVVGSPTAQTRNKWNQLKTDWMAGCVLGDNGEDLGFLVAGKSRMESLFLIDQQGNKKEGSFVSSWQVGEQIFSVFVLSENNWGENEQNWKINFSVGGEKEKKVWPTVGWAKMRFNQTQTNN